MKIIGRIKKLDNESSFGIIEIAGNIDINISNNEYEKMSPQIIESNVVIFELYGKEEHVVDKSKIVTNFPQRDNNSNLFAKNVVLPLTDDDFVFILSNIENNFIIKLWNESGYDEFRKYLHKNEKTFHNLFETALIQLMSNVSSTELFTYLKSYENNITNYHNIVFTIKNHTHLAIEYIEVIIRNLKKSSIVLNGCILDELNLELMEKYGKTYNQLLESDEVFSDFDILEDYSLDRYAINFFIKKLIASFLTFPSLELHFKIWRSKNILFDYHRRQGWIDGYTETREIVFDFPEKMFLANFSDLDYNDLSRIKKQKNGKQIVIAVIKKKMQNVDSFIEKFIDELLRSFVEIPKTDMPIEIWDSYAEKFTNLIEQNNTSEESILFKRYSRYIKKDNQDL